MKSDNNHWNAIFSSKEVQELGWYEDDFSQTIKFVEQVNLTSNSRVFLPGAGTSLLVDELVAREYQLILNDISDNALAKLSERISSPRCQYLHHNIATSFKQQFKIDMWIDRAVLHFLLSEEDITGYFKNLKASVKPEGYVLLAQFSEKGATKCAGLNIHQYSIEEMQSRLGAEFQLLASEEYTFVNQFNQPKPYVYGLFKRKAAIQP